MEEKKYAVLTFDDGPQASNERLLDILKEKNVKTSFFMVGKLMEERPHLVKRAIEEGHDVGWHTYDHELPAHCSKEEAEKDFDKAQPIIDKIYPGYKIELFRSPAGNITNELVRTAYEHGMNTVNWSNYNFNEDQENSVPAKVRAEQTFDTLTGIRDGEVILIHPRDNDEFIDGIGYLVDMLHEKGFTLVSLSEMFKIRKGVYVHHFFL